MIWSFPVPIFSSDRYTSFNDVIVDSSSESHNIVRFNVDLILLAYETMSKALLLLAILLKENSRIIK